MSEHGKIVDLQRNGSDYTLIFKDRNCYYCVKAYPRYDSHQFTNCTIL